MDQKSLEDRIQTGVARGPIEGVVMRVYVALWVEDLGLL